MNKRGHLNSITFLEIFLLISVSFAISFILNENIIVTAQTGVGTESSGFIGPLQPGDPGFAARYGIEKGGGGGITGIVKDIFSGGATLGFEGTGGFVAGAIFAGLAWAGVAFAAIQLIGGFLGLDNELTN